MGFNAKTCVKIIKIVVTYYFFLNEHGKADKEHSQNLLKISQSRILKILFAHSLLH